MAEKVTPMMRQYRRIKGELSGDIILFFRLGDFYEMFFDDARTAAPILDIALTKRNNIPMCGVPFHALDSYLSKMIRAGQKVAICEQVEDAGESKGIVRREVTRVVTPGTVTEENILDSKEHRYLASVFAAKKTFGLALLDLSTGLFAVEELPSPETVRDALRRYSPSECLVPSEQEQDPRWVSIIDGRSVHVTACEDWTFDYDAAYDHLVRHFDVQSLEGYGCEANPAMVGAAGGLFFYVKEDLRRQVNHIRSLRVQQSADHMILDESTCLNLDILSPAGRSAPSLLGVLDTTRTAMGGRKLRDWLLRPLIREAGIAERHDAVAVLYDHRPLLRDLRDALGGVRDLERLIARMATGGGNGRDVLAIGQSLGGVPDVRALLEGQSAALFTRLASALQAFPELVELIERAIVDEPPVTIKEGGVIRGGYHEELDDLRVAATQGKAWLAEYQVTEQDRTGIKNIKVRYNKVFGYYIEVSKGQLANVPEEYIRKQTLVNAERFITPELKEYENKILGAQDRAVALEYELFSEIRDAVVRETERIQGVADALAVLDVLASLADRALALRYVRPTVNGSDRIDVRAGRHPVVEQIPESERFVANDTLLDCVQNQLSIITGPNMAGKSTYIRQVAMIVIMAQMGSFVPADAAEIGVVDRVFTRVGASDDLARGRSTFMVEMEETANILNNATPRSLIVLDEIGRGTSTFDGISIAWAVAEFLHGNTTVKAKTLFATHYHELTDLALTMGGVKNYNIQVRERNDQVVFLRKIAPGGADKSYGIQVARLAGMPADVVGRAKEILANLEEGEFGETGQPKIAKRRLKARVDLNQLNLFD